MGLAMLGEFLALGTAGRSGIDVQAGGFDGFAAIDAVSEFALAGASQRSVDLGQFGGHACKVEKVAFALRLRGGIVVGLVGATGQASFGMLAQAIAVKPAVQGIDQLAASPPESVRQLGKHVVAEV